MGDEASTLADTITYHVFANSHIPVYPIPGMDGSVRPGERLISFVWYRNYLPGGELTDLMTDGSGWTPGDPELIFGLHEPGR